MGVVFKKTNCVILWDTRTMICFSVHYDWFTLALLPSLCFIYPFFLGDGSSQIEIHIPVLLFTWRLLVHEHLDTSIWALHIPKGNEGRIYVKHITKAFHETVCSLTQKFETYIKQKLPRKSLKKIPVSEEFHDLNCNSQARLRNKTAIQIRKALHPKQSHWNGNGHFIFQNMEFK